MESFTILFRSNIFLYWFKINHKVLSLYYLYDKDCSRVYRTIMLYVSLLGEISILTFFGKVK